MHVGTRLHFGSCLAVIKRFKSLEHANLATYISTPPCWTPKAGSARSALRRSTYSSPFPSQVPPVPVHDPRVADRRREHVSEQRHEAPTLHLVRVAQERHERRRELRALQAHLPEGRGGTEADLGTEEDARTFGKLLDAWTIAWTIVGHL